MSYGCPDISVGWILEIRDWRRKEIGRSHRREHTEGRIMWRWSKDWSNVYTSQGTARTPTATRSWVRGMKHILPQSLQKEPTSWPLDFWLLASKIVREYISVVLSHQICGNLLQYLQEANSAPILLLIHEHSTFLCQYPELKGGALESRGVAV